MPCGTANDTGTDTHSEESTGGRERGGRGRETHTTRKQNERHEGLWTARTKEHTKITTKGMQETNRDKTYARVCQTWCHAVASDARGSIEPATAVRARCVSACACPAGVHWCPRCAVWSCAPFCDPVRPLFPPPALRPRSQRGAGGGGGESEQAAAAGKGKEQSLGGRETRWQQTAARERAPHALTSTRTRGLTHGQQARAATSLQCCPLPSSRFPLPLPLLRG